MTRFCFATGFIILLTLFSCKDEEQLFVSTGTDIQAGVWIEPEYNDSVVVYRRASKFSGNSSGVNFNADGTFIERANSGFCGTPPIVYANYNGKWSISDSIINVNVGYWGGTVNYQWKLLEIGNDKLKIKIISADYFPEY